jgi:hypothetical protein
MIDMEEEKVKDKGKLKWNPPSIVTLDFRKTSSGNLPDPNYEGANYQQTISPTNI